MIKLKAVELVFIILGVLFLSIDATAITGFASDVIAHKGDLFREDFRCLYTCTCEVVLSIESFVMLGLGIGFLAGGTISMSGYRLTREK